MRTRTFLISCLVVSVIGFLLGAFVVPRYLPKVGNQPPSPGEAPAQAQDDLSGFCCFSGGQVCTAEPTAQRCLGNGGKLFHIDRVTCDNYCNLLGIVKN